MNGVSYMTLQSKRIVLWDTAKLCVYETSVLVNYDGWKTGSKSVSA